MTQPQQPVTHSAFIESNSCPSIDNRRPVTHDECDRVNEPAAVASSPRRQPRTPLGPQGQRLYPDRSPSADGRQRGNAEFQVVSRVPQPYYTSLSAVTAPVLVPRPTARPDACDAKSDGAGLGLPPKNLLGARRRTTSPGRIRPAAVVRLVDCAPSSSDPTDGGADRRATSVGERRLKGALSDSLSPEDGEVLARVASDACKSTNCSHSASPSGHGRGNDSHSADSSAVEGATAAYACVNEEIQAPLLPGHPLNQAKSCEVTDVRKATVETAMDARHSSDVVATLQMEISRVRSHTLPSKVHLSSKEVAVPVAEFSNSMKQSRSLSFTGLLSRMSPKSLRRLFSSTHHGTPKHNLDDEAVVTRDTSRAAPLSSNITKGNSFKKDPRRTTMGWFKGRRRSKDNEPGDRDPSKSIHVDAAIEPPSVESIPDRCRTTPIGGKSSSKSVSVRDAALGLVAQPLYVVEFPDDVDVSPLGSRLNDGDYMSALSPSSLDCVVESEKSSFPIKQGKPVCSVNVSRYRQLIPPSSLEVSAVHKMTKPIFRFPTSSPESIGHCSLDASSSADTGSEASLLKNGAPSSVCTSRRTLTSHDNIVASAPPAAAEDRLHDATTAGRQSPSYLKVSRCAGGYSTYTSYSSDRMTSSSSSSAHAAVSSQNGLGTSRTMTAVTTRTPDSVPDCAATSCVVTVVPRGGQRCQLTVVDNTIADLCSVPSIGAPGKPDRDDDAVSVATAATKRDSGVVAVRCAGDDASCTNTFINGGFDVQPSPCNGDVLSNGRTSTELSRIFASRDFIGGTIGNGLADLSVAIGSEQFRDMDSKRDSVNSCSVPPTVCNGGVGVCRDVVVIDGTGSDPGHSACNGDGLYSDARVDTSASSSPKDGAFYLEVVDTEERRLQMLCREVEGHLKIEKVPSLPDEVEGKIRAAIGKANLLTTKKFKQFRELCNKNLNEDAGDPFPTTVADLAGFWDMVLLQVADVSSMFDELRRLQEAGWKTTGDELSSKSSSALIAGVVQKQAGLKSRTARRGHPPTAVKTHAGKVESSSDSSRSRDEARQRLMAAKMAGRQRKVSESEKDIEIYVS